LGIINNSVGTIKIEMFSSGKLESINFDASESGRIMFYKRTYKKENPHKCEGSFKFLKTKLF
jgi:hypothetical protein